MSRDYFTIRITVRRSDVLYWVYGPLQRDTPASPEDVQVCLDRAKETPMVDNEADFEEWVLEVCDEAMVADSQGDDDDVA